MKKVLLKDIAERAGVSTTLVSFVLNDKDKKHRVGEETAKHIRKIAAEMNYTPNIAARSLRSGKTGVIGVVVSDISNPFFAQAARIIEDEAAKKGYTVFFGSTDENTAKFKTVVWGLINRGVEGLIVVPCEKCHETVEQLVANNVPLVLFDRAYTDIEASSVTLNNYNATYKATKHLIDSGYERPGMIAYNVDLLHMHERVRGYEAAMTDAGLRNVIEVDYVDQQEADKLVGGMVDDMLAKNVDALLLANNMITLASLFHLNKIKPDVPGKLGLIGFDGSDAFELFYSPLSYMAQPVEALAEKSVEVLVETITNSNMPVQRIMLEGKLHINKSSVK